MCHADSRQKAAVVIAAKPASALLQDVVFVWECGRSCVFGGGMSDATSLPNLFGPD